MDLTPTDAERALRDECRSWLRANLPWEYGRGLPPRFDDLAHEVAFGRNWQARLADRPGGGWGGNGRARGAGGGGVGVAGPPESGGRAAGPIGHYIVTEELARARAP